VRHRWLPLLERESPGIRAGLLRLARQAAEDAELLDRLAGRVVEEACPELPTGVPVTIRPGPVLAAPRALGRRAVAQWLRIACGGRLDLDAAVVNRVLGMLTGEGPRVLELPGVCLRLRRGKDGLTIERGRLVLSTPPAVLLSCPGETAAPGFRLAVRISHAQVPDDPRSPPGRQWLPIESLRPPLRLRAARRGDRFRPLGAPGSRLLSDLFGGKRIPVEARGAWPLVVDEEGILWVVGLAADERARVRPGDPALLIEVEPVGS
jgi:tRNA(Ile)-lysidine synthase